MFRQCIDNNASTIILYISLIEQNAGWDISSNIGKILQFLCAYITRLLRGLQTRGC